MNIKCLALNWTKVSLYSSKTIKGPRDDQCGSGLCYLFSRAGLHSMLRPERQGSSSGIVPNRMFLSNPVVPLSVPLNNFTRTHLFSIIKCPKRLSPLQAAICLGLPLPEFSNSLHFCSFRRRPLPSLVENSRWFRNFCTCQSGPLL